MQQGGGIGYDFSTLRPKGAPVKGVGADASGPVSFMDVWDAMCRTIMSRRLAARRDDGDAALRSSRHRGVHRGQARRRAAAQFQPLGAGDRRLHGGGRGGCRLGPRSSAARSTHRLRARRCGTRIMRATYDYAEPGVIFIDRINARNNLAYCETIQRHQSLRRAAAAALWRLPAGLDQPGAAGRAAVHRRRRALDEAELARLVAHRRAHDGQCHRRVALSAGGAGSARRRPSAASGSASPGWPTR